MAEFGIIGGTGCFWNVLGPPSRFPPVAGFLWCHLPRGRPVFPDVPERELPEEALASNDLDQGPAPHA